VAERVPVVWPLLVLENDEEEKDEEE